MAEAIRHTGIIEHVDGRHLVVRIAPQAACGACSLAARCNISSGNERLVDVYAEGSEGHNVGDSVVVTAASGTGRRAVMLGFGLPLALMLAVIIVVRVASGSDGISALCGLGSLIPYYIVLHLMRKSINRSLRFTLEQNMKDIV